MFARLSGSTGITCEQSAFDPNSKINTVDSNDANTGIGGDLRANCVDVGLVVRRAIIRNAVFSVRSSSSTVSLNWDGQQFVCMVAFRISSRREGHR